MIKNLLFSIGEQWLLPVTIIVMEGENLVGLLPRKYRLNLWALIVGCTAGSSMVTAAVHYGIQTAQESSREERLKDVELKVEKVPVLSARIDIVKEHQDAEDAWRLGATQLMTETRSDVKWIKTRLKGSPSE